MFRTIALHIKRGRELWLSLSFGYVDLISGAISALVLLFVIRDVPWILSILPVLLSVRGATNGVFSGVLSTSLHIGTIEPRFRSNTEHYYSLIAAVFTMPMLNALISMLILGIFFIDPIKMILSFFVLLLASSIAVVFSIIMTSFIGFMAFRKGFNPDDVVYPIMSTVNDVFASLFLVAAVLIIRPWDTSYAFFTGFFVFIILAGCVIYAYKKNKESETYKTTLREAYGGIIYSIFFSSLAGIILTRLYDYFVEDYLFLIILPFVMTILGDVSSVLVSRLTTALSLGEIEYRSIDNIFAFMAESLVDISAPLLFSLTIATFLVSILVNAFSKVLMFMLVVYLVSVFVLITEIPIIAGISVSTFKRGLNPDNFSIPIVTSTADFLTVLAFFVVVS